MSRYYTHNGYKKPSVTTIIDDCTGKRNLIQWSANMACEWIEENCLDGSFDEPVEDGDTVYTYVIFSDQLDDARLYHKQCSKKAMQIGSEVHAWIENFLKKRL